MNQASDEPLDKLITRVGVACGLVQVDAFDDGDDDKRRDADGRHQGPLAGEIATIHASIDHVPSTYVNVVFYELPTDSVYTGRHAGRSDPRQRLGTPRPSRMPIPPALPPKSLAPLSGSRASTPNGGL